MSEAVILLSGGLDSYLALVLAQKKMKIKLALTFDYGQEPFKEEAEASSKLCKIYEIQNEIIKLDFLSDLIDKTQDWVPNRNGLFINIAASYAEKYNSDYIVIGANKEEAEKFIDNSMSFLNTADEFFKYSTQNHPKIYAPLKNMTKVEIINCAIKENVDFSLIKSCYKSIENTGKKHCGECASCNYLKSALKKCNDTNLINLFF